MDRVGHFPWYNLINNSIFEVRLSKTISSSNLLFVLFLVLLASLLLLLLGKIMG